MKTRNKNNLVLLLMVICLSLMQAMPAQTAGMGIVYLPVIESRDLGVINKYAEIEPNDSKEQANRIFTNQLYSGRAEDDSDYYLFFLGQNGPVTITMNNAPAGAQMLLSTTPLTVANASPYVIQIPSLTMGQYALKIYTPAQSFNSNWIYTFEVATNNTPPDPPSNPSPANGVGGQNPALQLSWMGSDTDGDAVTYDVYFGSDNPPATLVSNDQTSLSYIPGILTIGVNYYWKVVAKDEHGLETAGLVWSFRVNQAPNMPLSPSPTNEATGVITSILLNWMGGDLDGDTVTYDVYFGKVNPPVTLVSDNQTGISYTPILTTNTTYFWRIVSEDEHGVETIGPVWQFRTYTPVAGMEYIPVGNFTRGCVAGHNGGDSCPSNELPSATIYLDSFYMDTTEVTNGAYAQCVAAGSCSAPHNNSSYTRGSYYNNPSFASYPVIYVDWNQATAYCTWAGKRLPTEAEWEKAARGTGVSTYSWGDVEPACHLVNFFTGSSYCVGDTAPGNNYLAGKSQYGVLNLAGNVFEWVNDWYASDYYSESPSSNPQGPASGTYHSLRGGGWNSEDIRLSLRGSNPPAYNDYSIGFRCASSMSD